MYPNFVWKCVYILWGNVVPLLCGSVSKYCVEILRLYIMWKCVQMLCGNASIYYVDMFQCHYVIHAWDERPMYYVENIYHLWVEQCMNSGYWFIIWFWLQHTFWFTEKLVYYRNACVAYITMTCIKRMYQYIRCYI